VNIAKRIAVSRSALFSIKNIKARGARKNDSPFDKLNMQYDLK